MEVVFCDRADADADLILTALRSRCADEYRCNDSFPSPSSFAPCAESTCLTGDLKHESSAHYGVGAWAVERLASNHSSGCVKHW